MAGVLDRGENTLQDTLFPEIRPERAASIGDSTTKHGVVFTKSWVVALILDMAGYVPTSHLYKGLLIEPSSGDGSFLTSVVERLLESCRLHQVKLTECLHCIAAFEIDLKSVVASREAIQAVLNRHLVDHELSTRLAEAWVIHGDYLLESSRFAGRADWVVGNPPYIRLEDLENGGLVYRNGFKTMVGRSDIYVAFFEAALRQLRDGAVCSFICADRWMFNQYGAELRRYVTANYSVDAVIQMHDADAFDCEVSAYPAVTVIRRASQGSTVVAKLERSTEPLGQAKLAAEFEKVRSSGGPLNFSGIAASRVEQWFTGSDPWPLMEPNKLAFLKRIEREFPTLEETGTIVGIGVATGADKVFITKDAMLVEAERLLPLAMAQDIKGSRLEWSGHYLVNPWGDNGLVDLRSFPKLSSHLERNRGALQDRHVGRKNPSNWFRTIDRVNHTLMGKAKLYLPDIKGRIAPVLDDGQTYPHHNLYFVSPENWDPEVLGGLLISGVAQFFVEAYGVKMRGGYLRFQAQYLRRIRVPFPSDISESNAERLRMAFRNHDFDSANRVASELYRMSPSESGIIGN